MATTMLRRNETSNAPYLTDFPERVRHGWFKSAEPDAILVCERQPDVYIWVNGRVNCRVVGKNGAYEWHFTIITTGDKRLRNVALISDDYRSNFVLKSVFANGTEIGVTNGQEWHDPRTSPNDLSSSKERRYSLRIAFAAHRHGTYRQNVIFGFRRCPVFLQRICADYLPINDYARIQTATDYQLSQIPPTWSNPLAFYSPFMPHANPREIMLSKIYPYPNQQNFFLTQDTLSDDQLTPRNYRGRMHEVITLEEIARHEQLSRYNQISMIRLLSHYVLTTSDGSTIAKYTPPGELFAQLPICRDNTEDTQSGRLLQRSCNSVLLKWKEPTSEEKEVIFEAHIEDISTHSVFIRLSAPCVSYWDLQDNSDHEVEIRFMLNRLSFCEWHLAVDSFENMDLVFLNDKYRQIDQISHFLQIDADSFNIFSNLCLDPVLNQEQKQAVTALTLTTKMSSPPPILLLGPFGTGKTFTLAHVLRVLSQDPRNRILLCTHSNSAADLYIKEFFNDWYKKQKCLRFKPVRIYYKLRALNTVHPVVQEYCLKDEHGRFRDPVEEDLQDCGLIVTTLTTSSCLANLNLSLTHIIIDEAAQAFECEVLIALTLANRDTRLILAGDQMQLAPEIYSVLAKDLRLDVSLLERLYEFYPREHPCRIHLCQNYRAHKDIIRYTSQMFYDGIVKPANKELMKHPTLNTLTFYAVRGQEQQGLHSTPGYYHTTEAQVLADRVLELKKAWPTQQWGPYNEESIGVLSYYAEQVQRLRIELRNRGLSDVSVERVLNVQGKQFTVIFISTVRTQNCCRSSAETKIKDYGFLTNPRLLNTALTRAKCHVAVVGDPVALLTIGSCKQYWNKYLEEADLYGMDRVELQNHLNLVPELRISRLNPLAQEFIPRRIHPCIVTYVAVPVTYPIFFRNNQFSG
ncbi:probable helicase with zinc finger domain [Ooceraea biroi]|nr:probable helicase with zinc finger domain [Ooceraea biroi]EZA52304.1 putative helicase with zinc finger domain [Ooceraea biroi]